MLQTGRILQRLRSLEHIRRGLAGTRCDSIDEANTPGELLCVETYTAKCSLWQVCFFRGKCGGFF